MNLIATFLEKFKKLSPPESAIKTAFINAVRVVLKIELSPHQIRIQRSTVCFDGNTLLRGEMMLKKNELLTRTNEELKIFARRITDIR